MSISIPRPAADEYTQWYAGYIDETSDITDLVTHLARQGDQTRKLFTALSDEQYVATIRERLGAGSCDCAEADRTGVRAHCCGTDVVVRTAGNYRHVSGSCRYALHQTGEGCARVDVDLRQVDRSTAIRRTRSCSAS